MWKKLRFWLRFIQVYARRYGWVVVIGVLLGAGSFWGLPELRQWLPRFRSTETIGIVGKYTEETLPITILSKVSMGLTQIDEQGKVFPGLAKQWEASGDGKVWTFELDESFTWSDGRSMKAKDLHFSFDDVVIDTTDDRQLRFQLDDPFSPFPSVMATPVLRTDFVGVGPYRFDKLKRAGQYLKSVELVPVNKSSLAPKLRFVFYGTEEAAKIEFKLGKLNRVEELLQAGEFASWHNVAIVKQSQSYRYVGLFFNTRKENFKEKSTRQALAYAINDKAFAFERVISPIMSHSWAHNPHVKPYEYDVERARSLWKQNGANQAETTEGKDQTTLELATVASLLPVAEAIAKDWQDFGVAAQVRVVNAVPDDFDVLLVTQEVPTDPDQYVLWHSTQATNLTGYKSPKIDKLLEEGRKELDIEKRKQIYLDFQRFLVEDLPAIFLFKPVTYTIERS